MVVYVDNYKGRFGRMTMCHMVADTLNELNTMADLIGIPRHHLQRDGHRVTHYDICMSKRTLAVKHGAVEITTREMVRRFPSH